MKLALHRSITFWSGLLVMGFVCWAWWDSLSAYSSIIYGRGWITQNAGGIHAGYDSKLHNLWSHSRTEGPSTVEMDGTRISVRYWVEGVRPPTAWPKLLWEIKASAFSVFLPFWLILLPVAALWLGLLFWRARRRRKAAAL